jgi:hypothetical protein
VIDAVLIAAQLTGFATWAVIGGCLLFGLYGWVLWVHRRGIDRGWWG